MDDNNEYKTYLNIVKHDGYALKDVPVERIDYRICLKSVKQHGSALRYVPEKFKKCRVKAQFIPPPVEVGDFLLTAHIKNRYLSFRDISIIKKGEKAHEKKYL